MDGEHVIRIKDGFFNGIWSDMAIETTYMKVGKGPSGMIGVTTNDRSVSIWANSHHFCGELLTELEHQRTRGQESPDMKHKEEGKGRINSDSEDRLKIRTALDKCIHPLDIDSHASSEILVNIYTGEESESSTNVHNALTIGKEQMTLFEKGLPESFRATLTSKVVLMSSVTDKKKKKSKNTSYNADLIFSRVLLLLGTNQIEFDDIFDYELAAVPTSLFDESGLARYPKNKADLMNKLKVEESSRCIKPEVTVIDGGGLLYQVHWPSDGLVKDLVDGIERYVRRLNTEVHLIFDRYKAGSIKGDTRKARVGAFRRCHQLSLDRELPPRDMVMFSSSTKENLIELISKELCKRFELNKSPNRFVVTSKSPVPEQVDNGIRTKRRDLTSYFDEADYAIPQHVHSSLIEGNKKSVRVMSKDADVFALLCHYFVKYWENKEVYMDPFSSESKVVSIKKSTHARPNIMQSIVALHAGSGCDAVPQMYGIGKGKSLSAAEKVPLNHIGEQDADMRDVIDEGKKFVAKCFGQSNTSSSKNRRTIWIGKTDGAKKSANPPTLKSLPPTDEALELNIKRAHFQAIMWKNCVTGILPALDPLDFGWERDGDSLRPSMLPVGRDVAPEAVLQMTRCKCPSSQCTTNRCSCVKAGASCTEFCGCQSCANQEDINCDGDDSDVELASEEE